MGAQINRRQIGVDEFPPVSGHGQIDERSNRHEDIGGAKRRGRGEGVERYEWRGPHGVSRQRRYDLRRSYETDAIDVWDDIVNIKLHDLSQSVEGNQQMYRGSRDKGKIRPATTETVSRRTSQPVAGTKGHVLPAGGESVDHQAKSHGRAGIGITHGLAPVHGEFV